MWKPIKSYNVAACMCKKVYSTLINLSTRLFVLPLPVAMNKTKKSQKVKFNELPSINQLLRSIKGILIHATRTWSIYFTKRMLELCRCIMRVWWQVEKLVSEVLFRLLSARSALSLSRYEDEIIIKNTQKTAAFCLFAFNLRCLNLTPAGNHLIELI